MDAYREQAGAWGHHVRIVDVHDHAATADVDAVFLRLDTQVLGPSLAAARLAWERGQRIVDDPQSLIACMNKAHVHGLLERAGLATPETILLTRAGREHLDGPAIFDELGSPVVVKAPSGAFSKAVERAYDAATLQALVKRFASRSDVLLLQEFTPSLFDWRVVVLCGNVLLACRYHIPAGAWRIHDVPAGGVRKQWAKVEFVPLDEAPSAVVELAVAAANSVGTSLYGVDLKELADGRVVVIEINDNPNLDFGQELPVGSELPGQIIDLIATRGPRR